MEFLKHTFLFIRSNLKKLQRKWLALPLFLLFPVFIVSLIAVVILSIFMPDETEPIQVGLVDQDKSDETEMVVDLIEESAQLGSFVNINALTEEQAKKQVNDHLSGYITFPEGFTANLYNGESVTLTITGNPDKQMEAYLIKELLDSIARHIRTSQANILTINYYAKQLPIDNASREDMLFQQFNNFLVYAVGKDRIIDDEEISNHASASPFRYFGLGAWFMIITIWLFLFYAFFTNDEQPGMQNRMRLYGVTTLQQLTAKIVTTLITAGVLTGVALCTYVVLTDLDVSAENYFHAALLTKLYSLIYLIILAILDVIFTGQKIRMLFQSIVSLIILLVSGAIIPTLYFPLYVQNLLPHFFASNGFYWLQEVLLSARFYADYVPMIMTLAAAGFILIAAVAWKERDIL
ncbi:ABC-2 type transport system permease protein [Lentibacillus persicus]|uniref:ABC-2 type transport system permease protein n=1 Tax=Lentibacillus persicus TaxID=640948 RepID=A0A1I1TVP6_9BACI|nr:ABC transporter permease [Lentibacillus persicus]SFD59630.1 ABC-2 type transport system permease protein [Lentibacillus persicus]